MTTELEHCLRDSLDHAARRFPPPPNLRDRVDERLASHDRRRRTRRLAAAAAVVVAVVAAAAAVRAGDGADDRRVATVAGPREAADGWVAATSSALGWRFEHPAGWTVQHFSGQCRVGFSGTVVTNLDRALRFHEPPPCTTSWDLGGVPDTFVAVEMSHMRLRPSFHPAEPDTAFPLAVDWTASTPSEAHPPQAPSHGVRVTLGGDDGYRVMVWFGTNVSAGDRAAVERIVASIRPTATTVPSNRDRECVGTKAPPPPPAVTFEVVGRPGNEWQLTVGPEGVTVAIRAMQRPDTEVHGLLFEIAPIDAPWPGSAIRGIPVETPLSVGANDLTVRWDGRDEDGRRVSPGLYRFYATLTQTTYREVNCADGSGRGIERSPNSAVSAGLGTFVVE